MFSGFSDRTFEFFMAIRFNNNRDFFHENHDWYEEAVRGPALALADALNPAIAALDDSLERRPVRVVSRINRDLRFTLDKSPYRDYIWLAFRRPGEMRDTTLGVYFDISDRGASCGMGFYNENRPIMNALRHEILTRPAPLAAKVRRLQGEFTFFPTTIKRMRVPEEVPPSLREWYPLRSFYLEKPLNDFALLKSPELADVVSAAFLRLKPLYRYLEGLAPRLDAEA